VKYLVVAAALLMTSPPCLDVVVAYPVREPFPPILDDPPRPFLPTTPVYRRPPRKPLYYDIQTPPVDVPATLPSKPVSLVFSEIDKSFGIQSFYYLKDCK
jgi:hypothetical protein